MPRQLRRSTDAVVAAIAAVDPIALHQRGDSVRAIANRAGAPWLRVKAWLAERGVVAVVRRWSRGQGSGLDANAYAKRRREARRRAGLCTGCGGSKPCERCRLISKTNRVRYEAKRDPAARSA